ncbi:LLM class flavin-dependent oxidoreductase [Rhodococcus sp. NPDC056743]|uniref:LLM class flavin-dependent oxidoreductase n=1 Tax=Rhodococcus sp. NPDC056743 TaxID=3345934 RepID=UPI00366A6FCE
MEIGILSLGDHVPNPHTGARNSQRDRLRSIIDSAVAGEDMGFSMIALGEHHFNDYIISSPELMLAAIAERTKRMRLATAVTLLATSDPVKVAEDFATLDLLSNGRAEIVVGRGINPETYAAFGSLDPKQGHAIMAEKVLLLDQLWNAKKPFSWSGEFRGPLDNVQLKPAPLKGAPRLWMGTGTTEESVRRTASQGLPLMLPSIFARIDAWGPLVKIYRELMEEQGLTPLVGSCGYLHVDVDGQKARTQWEPYLTGYVSWVHKMLGKSKPVDYQDLIEGTAMCGSPEEVLDRMGNLQEIIDPDIHLPVFDVGALPHEMLMDTMQLFASEIMPKL